MTQLADRVALVTGSTQGIGRHIAAELVFDESVIPRGAALLAALALRRVAQPAG